MRYIPRTAYNRERVKDAAAKTHPGVIDPRTVRWHQDDRVTAVVDGKRTLVGHVKARGGYGACEFVGVITPGEL